MIGAETSASSKGYNCRVQLSLFRQQKYTFLLWFMLHAFVIDLPMIPVAWHPWIECVSMTLRAHCNCASSACSAEASGSSGVQCRGALLVRVVLVRFSTVIVELRVTDKPMDPIRPSFSMWYLAINPHLAAVSPEKSWKFYLYEIWKKHAPENFPFVESSQDDGVWVTVATWDLMRKPFLFAEIGGVRTECQVRIVRLDVGRRG